MSFRKTAWLIVVFVWGLLCQGASPWIVSAGADEIRDLQLLAMLRGQADWGHWGPLPGVYSAWRSHSNRLIPIYTFGYPLEGVCGAHCAYRNEQKLTQLYGVLPRDTVNPKAEYCDQTDVYQLQKAAFAAGKKRIILFVFDGMDWQTTWAAAIYKSGKVGYREGRGTGLYFQDYRGAPTDFGYFCTSPHNDGTLFDVNAQRLKNPGGKLAGGYDPLLAGDKPWSLPRDPEYIIGQGATSPARRKHAYTDSSSSATSMTAGIKTYNDSINVDARGEQVETIAHQLQRLGLSVGAVTSVPISHATPACTYAHNVSRDDYQDLTRDLLGLKSVSHRMAPLPGLDVLIGCGYGEDTRKLSVMPGGPDELALAYTLSAWQHHEEQGDNFEPGNRYLTDGDLKAIDQQNGGRYQVAQRTQGQSGAAVLSAAAQQAIARKQRLFGYFGAKKGHLPFRTADGKFDPTYSANPLSRRVAADTLMERYSPADIAENPTLADMTRAALSVLSTNEKGFWLLVEAGDVDWANHANNIDDSIGAVISGDEAFRAAVEWIEKQPNGWRDTALFLTADHGHYLVLTKPEALITKR